MIKEVIQTMIRESLTVGDLNKQLRTLEREANNKGIYLELLYQRGYVVLSYIKREKASKGAGREFIERVKDLADMNNLRVGLDVDIDPSNPTVQKNLIRYYTGLGFKLNTVDFEYDSDLEGYEPKNPMGAYKPMMFYTR